MIKNAASQKIGAQMVSATDGSAFTGAVTVSVTGDAGTQATGSVGAGACTHEGNGYHTYAPAQAETNYDLIAFTFTGSGAIPQTVQVFTITGDAFARLGAPAGASVSADIAAAKVDTAAILADTGTDGVVIAAGAVSAAAVAADAGVEIAAAVWDRVLSGATHNIAQSAGRRLRQTDARDITSGTAQAGSSNSITLAAGEPATHEIFDGNLVVITEGTGLGQTRVIVEYNGTTKVATVGRAWEVTPDNTSVYAVMADQQADIVVHGLAQAGAGGSLTLSTGASATDDIYNGCLLYIRDGAGGQVRLITDYVGATRVATVVPNWATTPGASAVYQVLPAQGTQRDGSGLSAIPWSASWDAEVQSEVEDALTAYDPPTNTEMEARTLAAASYATASGVSAVETDTQDIQGRLPAALVGGRIDATVDATGMESGAIDAILDDTIGDGTLTMRQALRVLIAGMAGKLSGAATTTVTIRNTADSANVIVATVDADGNRSAVTVTP